MKKLLALALLMTSLACIRWPPEDAVRLQRCLLEPLDPGCAQRLDSGVADSGSSDAGERDAGERDAGESDAGVDSGIPDAGPWRPAWRSTFEFEPHFLVGWGDGGTLVGYQTGLQLQAVGASGPLATNVNGATVGRPTAAYEREGILVVGTDDRSLNLWNRLGGTYTSLVSSPPRPFVTTAVDLYPSGGDLAVAAYGDQDGGLGLSSFTAVMSPDPIADLVVPCTGTLMNPQRILPAPDAGPGVVVGNFSGSCGTNFNFSSDAGGFVGYFGGGIQGYPFAAEPDSGMVLGIVANELRLAFRPPGEALLSVASIFALAPVQPGRPVLRGMLTPVDVLDLGSDFLVVGFGSGTISMVDGGSRFVTLGQDVFVARLNAGVNVIELAVFVEEGDQTAVGALWLEPRLIIAGGCGADAGAGLCRDAGPGQSWLSGFDP